MSEGDEKENDERIGRIRDREEEIQEEGKRRERRMWVWVFLSVIPYMI